MVCLHSVNIDREWGMGGWIKKAGSRDWTGELAPSFRQWGTHRSWVRIETEWD